MKSINIIKNIKNIKTMKYLGLLTILFIFSLYMGCSQKLDPAIEIALALDYTGKNINNKCDIYSQELCARLIENKIPAKILVYEWRNDDKWGQTHAVVLFRTQDGKSWIMDNKIESPKWVPNSNYQQQIEIFHGPNGTATFLYAVGE
jgi:hypothetical protein